VMAYKDVVKMTSIEGQHCGVNSQQNKARNMVTITHK